MTQAWTIMLNLFAYSDGQASNNPQLKDFDYARRFNDIPTSKSRSQQHTVSESETESIMSLQRTLTAGASWTVSNSEGVTSRFTWSGTNPVLRTERVGSALTNSSTVNVVRQGNSSVVRLTFSAAPGTAIVAGDELFIGPNSGLSPLNQGVYTVVAFNSGGNWIEVLGRDMVNETAIVTTDPTDIYAFSAGPVRVGDFVKVSSSSFNFGNRGEFQITQVTSRFFEVQNSNVVPEGPVTADIMVYDQLYKLMYIETDQPINLYLNGSASPISIEPVQEGQTGLVGVFLMRGPVFSVSIENLGFASARVTSFFAA
jgi:hypothetical protein